MKHTSCPLLHSHPTADYRGISKAIDSHWDLHYWGQRSPVALMKCLAYTSWRLDLNIKHQHYLGLILKRPV